MCVPATVSNHTLTAPYLGSCGLEVVAGIPRRVVMATVGRAGRGEGMNEGWGRMEARGEESRELYTRLCKGECGAGKERSMRCGERRSTIGECSRLVNRIGWPVDASRKQM